jgi:hypothetical protein
MTKRAEARMEVLLAALYQIKDLHVVMSAGDLDYKNSVASTSCSRPKTGFQSLLGRLGAERRG